MVPWVPDPRYVSLRQYARLVDGSSCAQCDSTFSTTWPTRHRPALSLNPTLPQAAVDPMQIGHGGSVSHFCCEDRNILFDN